MGHKENILEKRRRFQSALGASDLKLISLKQIHSDVIHLFDALPAETCQGDASITNRSGLLLGVQTADCVPILLVDTKSAPSPPSTPAGAAPSSASSSKPSGKCNAIQIKPADLLAPSAPPLALLLRSRHRSRHSVSFQFTEAPECRRIPHRRRTNPIQWLNMMPPATASAQNVLLDFADQSRQLLAPASTPEHFCKRPMHRCRDLLFSYRKEGTQSGRLMSVIASTNSRLAMIYSGVVYGNSCKNAS